MARIRSLKPDFWDHEGVGRLSREARLLFLGMISQADDYGTLKAGAAWIRSRIFPYDNDLDVSRIRELLAEIELGGFIGKYENHTESFYKIKGWEKHQRVQHPGERINPQPPPELFMRSSRESHESLTPDKYKYKDKEKEVVQNSGDSHETPRRVEKTEKNYLLTDLPSDFVFLKTELEALGKELGIPHLKAIQSMVNEFRDQVRSGVRKAPVIRPGDDGRRALLRYISKYMADRWPEIKDDYGPRTFAV